MRIVTVITCFAVGFFGTLFAAALGGTCYWLSQHVSIVIR